VLRPVMLPVRGVPGQCEPATPEAFARAHALWASDLSVLRPFVRAEGPGGLGPVWETAAGADAVDNGGGEGPSGQPIVLCAQCGSTMDVARALAEQGMLGPFGSVLALDQHAGRGQLRRQWRSQAGNVQATLACPPETGAWNDLRPLVLGYLFAQALSALGEPVSVKWPNDLLCGDRKVAGMLVEERPGVILAGIGINLAWAPEPELLREDHKIPAGQFHIAKEGVGPLRLWAALVNNLETGYKSLLNDFSPGEFLVLFRTRMAWRGRRVLVREGVNDVYEAVVRGVSDEGALVLDRAGRESHLLSGDVIPL
jgi:BirA family biotin operon repressor/biotin-[acetyl-CoA-carboxylase] ligase